MNLNLIPDKIFPVEVENIKDFMHDTFTTNVNGFSLSELDKLKKDYSSISDRISNFYSQGQIRERVPIYNHDNNKYYLERLKDGIDSRNLNKYYLNGRGTSNKDSKISDDSNSASLEDINSNSIIQSEKLEEKNENENCEEHKKQEQEKINYSNNSNIANLSSRDDADAKNLSNLENKKDSNKKQNDNGQQQKEELNNKKSLRHIKPKVQQRQENEDMINNHKMLRIEGKTN